MLGERLFKDALKGFVNEPLDGKVGQPAVGDVFVDVVFVLAMKELPSGDKLEQTNARCKDIDTPVKLSLFAKATWINHFGCEVA